jgi:hypothetical protein
MPKIRLYTESRVPELILAIMSAIVIAFALWTANAKADGFTLSGPGGVIIVAPHGSAEPHVIQVPRDLSPDAEDRARKWEAFCQPTPVVGKYGVTYLHYAHEGCEFGRDQ